MKNPVACAPGSNLSLDLKAAELARRGALLYVDAIDARGARAGAAPGDEALDRRGVTLGDEFDSAVGGVADPAAQAQAAGGRLRRGPEADALHVAADDDLHALHDSALRRQQI